MAGGWQFSGIGTITTGRPFTVFMRNGVNNGAPSWPNRIASGEIDDPTVDLWYNPRDFVAPPANTYGDTGRGILYGPGHVNLDTALSKRFMELRLADGGTHHLDGRRRPIDAVLTQDEFPAISISAGHVNRRN